MKNPLKNYTSKSQNPPSTAGSFDNYDYSGNNGKKKYFTYYEKCGLAATSTIILGTLFILASISFLWFLWLADSQNFAWHQLAVKNGMPQAVTLSALVIRTAVSFQVGLAVSMIACLALENISVLLSDAASVSTARNVNNGPYLVAYWLFKAFIYNPRRGRSILNLLLIVLFCVTTILIQFSSTVLLSDLNAGLPIPGFSKVSADTKTNYELINGTAPLTVQRGPAWLQRPPSYPTFAEYHEPPKEAIDGVSDTGTTLRAFLPVFDAQKRSLLKEYKGRATVLDARVVCMRPNVEDITVHIDQGNPFSLFFGAFEDAVDGSLIGLNGTFNIPFDIPGLEFLHRIKTDVADTDPDTGEFAPPVINDFDQYKPVHNISNRGFYHFSCLSGLTLQKTVRRANEWKLSICEPDKHAGDGHGGIWSAFRNITWELSTDKGAKGSRRAQAVPGAYGDLFGATFLAMNVSSGNSSDWSSVVTQEDGTAGTIIGNGTVPVSYRNNGEWLDIFFDEAGKTKISLSACFAAYDNVDLDVEVTSIHNRTEPILSEDTYIDIHKQMGLQPNGKFDYAEKYHDYRNIMTLQSRDSWLPNKPNDYHIYEPGWLSVPSWFRQQASMVAVVSNSLSNVFDTLFSNERVTAFFHDNTRPQSTWSNLTSIDPDPDIVAMAQTSLKLGAPIAHTLQTVITILSGMTYYNQLPQFTDKSIVETTSFVTTSARVRFRGLIGVSVVVGVHLVMLGIVFLLFVTKSRLSTVNNSWQSVAQVQGELTRPLLDEAPLATDERVGKWIGSMGLTRRTVGIGITESGKTAEIISYES